MYGCPLGLGLVVEDKPIEFLCDEKGSWANMLHSTMHLVHPTNVM